MKMPDKLSRCANTSAFPAAFTTPLGIVIETACCTPRAADDDDDDDEDEDEEPAVVVGADAVEAAEATEATNDDEANDDGGKANAYTGCVCPCTSDERCEREQWDDSLSKVIELCLKAIQCQNGARLCAAPRCHLMSRT